MWRLRFAFRGADRQFFRLSQIPLNAKTAQQPKATGQDKGKVTHKKQHRQASAETCRFWLWAIKKMLSPCFAYAFQPLPLLAKYFIGVK